MPRSNGQPTLAEILVDSIIHMVGKSDTLDGVTVIAELTTKLGRNPSPGEVEDYLGVDRSRHKSWPIEEDCKGCDMHKDGPHRFGCRIHGARTTQLVVSASENPDGSFTVDGVS